MGGFDRVGEPPPDGDAEDHRGDAFDYHDPAPAAQAGDAFHVADAEGGNEWVSCCCWCCGLVGFSSLNLPVSENSPERAGDGSRDEEVADPQRVFALCVEEGEVDGLEVEVKDLVSQQFRHSYPCSPAQTETGGKTRTAKHVSTIAQYTNFQSSSREENNLPNPGNSPPSSAPRIIRQATSPLKPCVMPVNVATTPHAVVMKLSHLEGVNFLITRLLGSSLEMYVTNSSETAIWYWPSARFRSSSMP